MNFTYRLLQVVTHSCNLRLCVMFANSSMTYTVINAVQKVKQFLRTSFCCFFATIHPIGTPLQLLLGLCTVRVVTAFSPQNFLRILQAKYSLFSTSYLHIVCLWQTLITVLLEIKCSQLQFAGTIFLFPPVIIQQMFYILISSTDDCQKPVHKQNNKCVLHFTS